MEARPTTLSQVLAQPARRPLNYKHVFLQRQVLCVYLSNSTTHPPIPLLPCAQLTSTI